MKRAILLFALIVAAAVQSPAETVKRPFATAYRVLIVYQDPISDVDNDEIPGVSRYIIQYECHNTVLLTVQTCAVDIARGGVWSVRYPGRFIGPGAILFTQVEIGPSLIR